MGIFKQTDKQVFLAKLEKNNRRYQKFSQNVLTIFFYLRYNFQKISVLFELFIGNRKFKIFLFFFFISIRIIIHRVKMFEKSIQSSS